MEKDFALFANESAEKKDTVLKFTSRSTPATNHLWVIGAGKGGVGKTFVTSSMAITLAKLGRTVTIVDFDLSGSNIHTSLGLNPSLNNIRHYFDGNKELQELVINTNVPSLSYIQGFWDSTLPKDFSALQVQKFISDLKKLKSEFILVDLGAGSLNIHLELFKAADEKILVTSPEPTSIEKTYRFIEHFMCYSLRNDSDSQSFDKMAESLRHYRAKPFSTRPAFNQYLYEQNGVSLLKFQEMMKSPVRLLVNSLRLQSNENLGHSIKSVCHKFYRFDLDYIGHIDFDNAVWQSLRGMEHVLLSQPFSSVTGQFLTTCKHLIDPKDLRAVV